MRPGPFLQTTIVVAASVLVTLFLTTLKQTSTAQPNVTLPTETPAAPAPALRWAPPHKLGMVAIVNGSRVTRFYDYEEAVVCYVTQGGNGYRADAIACVPTQNPPEK